MKSTQTTPAAATLPRGANDIQLICYLEDDLIDCNAKPLGWWHETRSRSSLLSKAGQKYMCISATSTPLESFKVAGNIVTPLHSFLKPHKVNIYIYINIYMYIQYVFLVPNKVITT